MAFLTLSVGTLAMSSQPASADPFMPSVADQIKLGDQAAVQTEQQYRVLHNNRSDQMERVGARLLQGLGRDRGPWHWNFHLIDSKEVNAFALPGGNLFFFSGLMDQLNSDDQVAAVMGHEMTHVRKQHWAHMQADSQKRQLGILVLLGLAHANNNIRSLASLGDSLYNLKYSRTDEEQADLGGLQDMRASGYNPNGMIELFKVLQRSGGGGTPEFLSDHPLTGHRIAAARKVIARMGFQPES